MKNLLFLILCCGLMVSCAVIPQMREEPPPVVDPVEMDKNDTAALLALEQARLKVMDSLETYPFVRLPSADKINMHDPADYTDFRITKTKFTTFSTNTAGVRTLGNISQYTDDLGRRSLSRGRIVYHPDELTETEAETVSNSLHKVVSAVRSSKERKMRNSMNEDVREFQKIHGLTVDGIMGPQTIGSFVENLSILDIQEITVQPVYTEKPEFEAYIIEPQSVPEEILKQGFSSIEEVRKKNLTLAQIRASAEPGKEFLICIYFLDRVHPAYALKWGITTASSDWSDNTSQVVYAIPGSWSIIIDSFIVQEKLPEQGISITIYNEKGGLFGMDSVVGSFAVQ